MSKTLLTPELESEIARLIKQRIKKVDIIKSKGISKRNFYNWLKKRKKLITAEQIAKNKKETIIS